MNTKYFAALASTITAVACATAATASVDRSPPPGGVYRLKPGIYVDKTIACGDAPNVAIRRYDGLGISGAHTHSCKARVISRKGSSYTVSQTCVDAGMGRAARVTERQSVTVADALTFSLATTGAKRTFRYCPIYMLPKGVR